MDGRKARILFNAEAFGFGPSAAIAILAQRFGDLGGHSYAGTGHSLELQRNIPYERIHDLTGADSRIWCETLEKYDIVFTAMDLNVARLAMSLGKPLIFYDALTWYWKDTPSGGWPAVQKILRNPHTLYIAQDFFGVRDRLKAIPPAKWRIVPPVLPFIDCSPRTGGEPFVAVNLGGLKNPYIDDQTIHEFGSSLISALRKTVPAYLRLEIAANEGIAAALQTCHARTRSPNEVATLLTNCEYAVCTPGLGNIYEAAACGKRVLWLPPANDSQGLQLTRLREKGMIDADVDWERFDERIEYASTQESCLRSIGNAMKRLVENESAFTGAIDQAISTLDRDALPRLDKLMKLFRGRNGADIVVAEIQDWAALL